MIDGTAPTEHVRSAAERGRRRAPRSGRGRWLVGGAVAALATVLGLTLALRSGAAPACAAPGAGRNLPLVAAPGAGRNLPLVAAPVAAKAPPTAGTVVEGKATFYDSRGAGGNCSYPSAPADRLYVALGPDEYAAGAACGGYLTVTGPKGSVRVLVMDQCPECAPGHIDLSKEAFARIADPVQGIVSVSYRLLADPPLRGPLAFRIKEGASRYWFAVLVADHGNPLRAVEVRQGDPGGWRAANRASYNYWLIDAGAGPGPYQIRVTDTRGHRVTATGIRMAPGQVQRGSVRMYGAGSAPAPSAKPSRPPSASASPTPRPSVPSATATPTPAGPAGTTPAVAAPPGEPPVADVPAERCG
ncbi:Peptidoglycan-binding domain-containing protein, expansin [Micromonospora nigra]|uniref:Peptidoglycan-binding domain-containing protein, expansin n=1 Tax=Micromonospora nigra TaxID=145857 RepID=A0A1C6SHV8_9ACTN|nr:expansin EXLX1 family cellulose-binding protein [Micromonospora nigra]SCL29090.1 Peptidoglycan-binding domain-containing protein, expansin [Micromonospora nigra]